MGERPVLYEAANRIGMITLNRPDHRNAMTPELLDAFSEAITQARSDKEIRCLVMTGRGRCFSAGADLRSSMQRSDLGKPSRDASFAMYEPFLRVLDVEVPVLAAMNGHAVGGGFGLTLLADIRVANLDAKYGANFARLGIHSGLGISYLLPRLVGAANASELLFTGKLIRGDEALRIGLVTHAEEASEVLPTAMGLARAIAGSAPRAVRQMKASIRRGLRWEIREAALEEARLQAESLATDDAKEGVSAILQKREPEFTGK
ncbi:MAG: enoyl-CoA hydratase/isomerase family protein [Deltaproteobacteria bacterium]|nr:enoyl-CoA hydratase/isomerase family protein [Deltaproteobacteria bacterium]MBW1875337.1 enoyl-CoA hydratase/isomerase family protein [Deltaproteobacteria bacterium]MBW2211932.1 enoyl-CoA hydratase/isomerase family protein [Deltaproteobacteria bacterium]MBW2213283.1 enoyl-CoA hydratase/isomerase family protein [Deltaproteobacteria bacterium]MBW2378591.1 enoyl-CoA hydratase/isomerase family protein [Deltaproteobacteria bacterium]